MTDHFKRQPQSQQASDQGTSLSHTSDLFPTRPFGPVPQAPAPQPLSSLSATFLPIPSYSSEKPTPAPQPLSSLSTTVEIPAYPLPLAESKEPESAQDSASADQPQSQEEWTAFQKKAQVVASIGIQEYSLVDWKVGDGNCHGYTFRNDPKLFLPLETMESIIEEYQNIPTKAITVFMQGDGVAHSALGHDDQCTHKVGRAGPIIQCSAEHYATAAQYTKIYKFPTDFEIFRKDAITKQKFSAEFKKAKEEFLVRYEKRKNESPLINQAFCDISDQDFPTEEEGSDTMQKAVDDLKALIEEKEAAIKAEAAASQVEKTGSK